MRNRLLPTALLQEGGAWTQPSEQRQSLACGGLTPVLWSWDLVLSPQLDPEAVSVSAGSQGPAPACPALTPRRFTVRLLLLLDRSPAPPLPSWDLNQGT